MSDIQDPHAEYPKMMFKQGGGTPDEHQLEGVKLHVAGIKGLGYRIVRDRQEEGDAAADGWSLTPACKDEPRKPDPRDAEIEELRRQLEEATAPKPEPKAALSTKEAK